jgi:hypothetical protein
MTVRPCGVVVGAMSQIDARIPTFLSHSYGVDDRAVNEHFFRLFWGASFAFTVDPKSSRISIPHLEHTLRYSACFVGVVTRREGQARYRTSPYMVFEYGMALQAKKPRLIFLERGVAGRYFEPHRTVPFVRTGNGDVRYDRGHAEKVIGQLHQMAEPHSNDAIRPVGSVGLVLPDQGVYRTVVPAISDILDRAGYDVKHLPYRYDHRSTPSEFIQEIDRHDFIVIDVGAQGVPSWLHALLYGRCIPMIRLLYHPPGESPEEHVPEILRGDSPGG